MFSAFLNALDEAIFPMKKPALLFPSEMPEDFSDLHVRVRCTRTRREVAASRSMFKEDYNVNSIPIVEEFTFPEADVFQVPEFSWPDYPEYNCPYVRACAKGKGKGRRGRNRRSNVSVSGADRTETIPGKILIPVTIAAGGVPVAIPLAVDSMGARLTALGNVFQEHRFTKLTVVLHPGFTAAAGTRASYAVAYFKVPPLTPPVTVPNAYSGAVSRYHDVGDTIPVRLSLTRGVLMNNVRPWFINNSAAGSETLDSIQGVLYIVPLLATGLSVNLEFAYSCQMRGPTLPAVD